MSAESVVEVLTQEHHDLDRTIEEFVAGVSAGTTDAEPLLHELAALRRHIYLEEEFLFPPMQRKGLMMPILVMQREHGDLWRAMESLTDAIARLESDPDARTQALGQCTDLLALLAAHNSKEEPIVYPQTGSMLDADELAALDGAMQTEGMPEGWVCKEAAERTPLG